MTAHSFKISVLSAAAIFAFAPSSRADDSLRAAIAADYQQNLKALFIHFHENPELSFKEFKTSARIAQELRALGFDVTEKVGGTGVVAVMKNGPGPTVMLRADMDGLPLKEQSGLAYASAARQVDIAGIDQPVMHACGHDTHITALVGEARQLARLKDKWSGTLVLIAQPAEERISGARDMMKDGLYKRFPKPDYALAFHVAADKPAGKIVVPQAIAYSSSDSVDIHVHGVGTHGASPHKGIDTVLVASQIVVSLQSIVSRNIDPLEPGVITVGSIHGGVKHNIIGDRVDMQLTVRADDEATREKLLDGIDRVAKGVAISLGVPKDKMPEVVRSATETTPPTINDTPTAAIIKAAFEKTLPAGTVIDAPRSGMGAEDFAYFVAPDTGVKGVYFQVGGTPEKDIATAAPHHSPFFKITPEPVIESGIEAMVVGAMTLMPKE
ncbi:MAG: amidohydrolase [Alphaproteobacteria bacterium]|nr:amidohydrolase [Alphaproteobacteria bacterium]